MDKSTSTVSGEELFLWREEARQKAIACDIAPQELDWLLQEVTNLDGLTLRLESFRQRPQITLTCSFSQLRLLWQQRINHRVPVQYLAGRVSWRNFKLKVSPAVLIPRPETELIIEIAKSAVLITNTSSHWVDLGTGTGAIALGLAEAFPQSTIHAVDCSQEALEIARENAQTTNLQQQVSFYHGSWWSPLSHLQGQVTGMVSNPPYIPSQELPQLQPEVFHHEPHLALDGGQDGLNAIGDLVTLSPDYLIPGGIWLIEMMIGQGAKITAMLSEQGSYRDIKIIKDLGGIERFVLAYRT